MTIEHNDDHSATIYFWNLIWNSNNNENSNNPNNSAQNGAEGHLHNQTEKDDHVVLKILDSIVFSDSTIKKWLFTHVNNNNKVMSKAKKRYNAISLLDRLTPLQRKGVYGHLLAKGSNNWRVVTESSQINDLINNKSSISNIFVAVEPNNLHVIDEALPASTYLKISYRVNSNGFRFSEPKIQVLSLCDKSTKGVKVNSTYSTSNTMISGQSSKSNKKNQSKSTANLAAMISEQQNFFPSEEIPCRNNLLVQSSREFIFNVVKIIEEKLSTHNYRVIDLALVVLVRYSSIGDQMKDFNSKYIGDLWLHHIKSIKCGNINPSSGSSNHNTSNQDGQSTSGQSQQSMSHSSSMKYLSSKVNASVLSAFLKPNAICCGDFCDYHSSSSSSSSGSHSSSAEGIALSILGDDYEDFDIKSETRRAMKQNKLLNESMQRMNGISSAEKSQRPTHAVQGEENDDENVDFNRTNSTSSLSNNSNNNNNNSSSHHSGSIVKNLAQTLPTKQREVLNRSIALARVEMDEIVAIENNLYALQHSLGHKAHSQHSSAAESTAAMSSARERIASLWPLPIAKWFLSHGKSMFRNHRLGKVRLFGDSLSLQQQQQQNQQHLQQNNTAKENAWMHRSLSAPNPLNNYQQLPTTTSSTSSATDDSRVNFLSGTESFARHHGTSLNPQELHESRWFSFHHTAVSVCEHCYQVYKQLDKHRAAAEKRQRQAQKCIAEEQMTEEERRARDKQIEARIFQQRKLATKLSQHKQYESATAAATVNTTLLPPLPPRRFTKKRDPHEAPDSRAVYNYHRDSSLVKHLFEKPAERPPAGDGGGDDHIEELWKSAVEPSSSSSGSNGSSSSSAHKMTFHEMNVIKNSNKPVVLVDSNNLDSYTAERLLHPWQRELQRMKKLVHGNTPADNSTSTATAQQEKSNKEKKTMEEFSMKIGDKVMNPFASHSVGGGDDDDEDDEDAIGGLGWNPFSLAESNVNDGDDM